MGVKTEDVRVIFVYLIQVILQLVGRISIKRTKTEVEERNLLKKQKYINRVNNKRFINGVKLTKNY